MTSKTSFIDDIYAELISCVTRDGSLTQISKSFRSLTTDEERIADCYYLLSFYNLLPTIEKIRKNKSPDLAEKLKNEGNKAFIYKDDNLALYYYNRALTYAPNGSKVMFLIFANRSAVTFSLEDYSDSIKDIDRALRGDYPENLKYKLLERKGKALIKLARFIDADIALKAAKEYLSKSSMNIDKLKNVEIQLNSLLSECRSDSTQKKSSDFSTNPFKLTHNHSSKIQSGSAAIDIAYLSEMGRHLVATTDIFPGDVLAIEKPFSSITLPSCYLSHCSYCQKRCHSMMPCTECSMVCYCDELCLKNAWQESHRIECHVLKLLLQMQCGKMELLSLRVLLNATKCGKDLALLASSLPDLEAFEYPDKKGFEGDVYLSNTYKAVHSLEGNTHLRDVSYLFCRSVVAVCITHILDIHSDFFSNSSASVDNNVISELLLLEKKCGLSWQKIFTGSLLLKYLQSMASNAHEVSEILLLPTSDGSKVVSSEVGSAVYPLLSLINHSCDPNVVRHSHSGSIVVLTAIQVIKKGEQIFDNYGFHHATHTKEERHSHLKSQYRFTCQCTACSENWPPYGHLPNESPVYHPGSNQKNVEVSSKKYKCILGSLSLGSSQEMNTSNLLEWLSFLCGHLRLLQESIKRPWQEFSACQEAIKRCQSFLANHYIYRSYPESLIKLVDKETGLCPFQYVNMQS